MTAEKEERGAHQSKRGKANKKNDFEKKREGSKGMLGVPSKKESKAAGNKKGSKQQFQDPESEEEDDDSPYFMKITLDEMFLSHLQMPDIVSSSEVEGKYDEIVKNSHFRQII